MNTFTLTVFNLAKTCFRTLLHEAYQKRLRLERFRPL